MDNFIVSARKYRPSTFDMVVGQESITNTLKNAIKNKLLAQAYLFCGPRGVGKTTCARIFAKTINCSNLKESGEACDECESCKSFNTLRSFNIHELDAASNNKVDDIRSLTDQVRIPPQIGKYSIYIIDEVHMLSASAFNAFLKTLEEPPAHAIFILATTEKHKIIPTILSRCQIFDFRRIKNDDIVNRLIYVARNEAVTFEEDALHIIAQKADGALRDALSIFDQMVSFTGKKISYKDVIENLNVLDYEYYFKSVDAALNGNVSDILLTFNEILENGFEGHNFIAGLNSHLRDLLVSKDESTMKLLETAPSVKQRYCEQTGKCSLNFLYEALEIGSSCDLAYKNSKNPRLHVEISLVRLCRLIDVKPEQTEKKKSDAVNAKREIDEIDEIPLPSRADTIISVKEQVNLISPDHNHKHGNYNLSGKETRSVSIKNLISEEKVSSGYEKDSGNPNSVVEESFPYKDFTENELLTAWSEFAEMIKSDGPRIAGMVNTIKPELGPEHKITMHLHNEAIKETFILNYKPKLINFLSDKLENRSLEIEIVVDLTESNDILYTAEQKFNFLNEKYPVLKDLKKSFNLDFD
jgi:DNA polymerase-3 subunit gamma/tau